MDTSAHEHGSPMRDQVVLCIQEQSREEWSEIVCHQLSTKSQTVQWPLMLLTILQSSKSFKHCINMHMDCTCSISDVQFMVQLRNSLILFRPPATTPQPNLDLLHQNTPRSLFCYLEFDQILQEFIFMSIKTWQSFALSRNSGVGPYELGTVCFYSQGLFASNIATCLSTCHLPRLTSIATTKQNSYSMHGGQRVAEYEQEHGIY